MRRILLTAFFLLNLGAVAASADERDPSRKQPLSAGPGVERIIVKMRAGAVANESTAAENELARIAARAGLELREFRRLGRSTRMRVLRVDPENPAEPLAQQLQRLRADPELEYAEVDQRRYISAVPNDPLYPGQWYLQKRSDAPSAIDAEHGWDLTTGSAGVVIAVLDSGVRFEHADLGRAGEGGRLLPGYDFISDPLVSNDGDGRDDDASDPGDWVTASEAGGSGIFADCTVADSSWHGTRVSGILGAETNNSRGLAGTTWATWLLPVRVIGKCGGYDSDILAAMLWAAGISIDGVPDNTYPAQLENLSLGSSGPCPASYRDVIGQLMARGVTVVASAGNEGGPVDAPANCPGVAGVAGLRHAGTKVGYSSLGTEVALGAPAGNCVNLSGACLYSIDTTSNLGTTAPTSDDYTDQLDFNVGTSFSAPIVTAAAALMLAVNGRLAPAELIARLAEGAAAFPVSADPSVPQCHVPAGANDLQPLECSCTTSTCGAGMLNVPGALTAASRPIAVIEVSGTVSPGQRVTLSAVASSAACGHSITSYEWSLLDTSIVSIIGADQAIASVDAPISGEYTARLRVTDDAGRTDTADVLITPNTATTPARTGAGSDACLPLRGPPQPVSVSVTPATANISPSGTLQLTAIVENTADTAVVWAVEGIDGGNASVGTVSSAGLYHAPASVSATSVFAVTAAWSEDRTRFGTAHVTVTPASTQSSSGHGGGSIDLLTLLMLIGALVARRAATHRGAGAE